MVAVVGLVAGAAVLRADDDDKAAKLPWNPFAEATAGDWTACKVRGLDGSVVAAATWTIAKVEGEKVTVQRVTTKEADGETESADFTFSTKEAPTIEKYLELHGPRGVRPKAAVERTKVETPCGEGEKLSFAFTASLKASVVVARTVKGTGLVSTSVDAGRGSSALETVGHGSKDKTIWGELPAKKAPLDAEAKKKIEVAREVLKALKVGCLMYETDHGFFPRRATAVDEKTLLLNDNAALYAALRNRRTVELGGGVNSPYIEWKPEAVGHAKGESATPLGADEAEQLGNADFQKKHGPSTKTALVLLDPWKNPWVYREWASVPAKLKENQKEAHDKNRFDVYSFGPNGKDEKGEGDDIASWSR